MTTKTALARLDWSLYVDCPHCDETFDLVDYDSDNDYGIAKNIFTNQWGALKGREITCPHCQQEFELENVEY